MIPLVLLLAATISLALTSAQGGVGIHLDFPHARVVVTWVVDGDTVRISPPVYVGDEYRTVVRLADIDAPPINTTEGQQARDALRSRLAQYGGVVLLDIDKARGVDNYSRVIAVLYVRVNETHLLNVNEWMVEKGYAVIDDSPDNDFDPSKWTLYVEYHVVNEKLPEINRVVIDTGDFAYNTSWGVRVAVTPDGNYIGVAYADFGGNYVLHVRVLDRDGNIVKSFDYSPDKGSNWYADVFRGMIDIAANKTGFMVAWTNWTRARADRVVLYSYVPISGEPTTPSPITIESYQYHPLVTYFVHANGTKWWVIGYGRQISSIANYTLNLINLEPRYVTRSWHCVLAGTAASNVNIGVDVMSRMIYDPVNKSVIVVARNKTAETGHDIIAIHAYSHATLGFWGSPFNIDNRLGDQGPSTDMTNTYSYYNVYPMHTGLLYSGGYVLTVYNETSTALAYAVVNLSDRSVIRQTLIDYYTPFYPWVAGGSSRWLLGYDIFGWINITLVGTDGSNTGLIPLADRYSGFVRPAYDAGFGLFPVAYGVRDLDTGNYNVFLALVNETDGSISSFVIPVNTTGSVNKRPINTIVLPGGSPGTVVVFTVEGSDLVAYYISSTYSEALQPVPIPEPILVSAIVAGTTGVLLAQTIVKKKAKHKKL